MPQEPQHYFIGPGLVHVPFKPWLVEGAIEFIGSLPNKGLVVETGAGGSTIWLGQRFKKVITYEHDYAWFMAIKTAAQEMKLNNIQFNYDPQYPLRGILDLGRTTADLILVDGRGRVQTIMSVWNNLKPGGWLCLDNAERVRYSKGMEFLNLACSARFEYAKRISLKTFWKTMLWRKSKEFWGLNV